MKKEIKSLEEIKTVLSENKQNWKRNLPSKSWECLPPKLLALQGEKYWIVAGESELKGSIRLFMRGPLQIYLTG